jgi:hypothetical protein
MMRRFVVPAAAAVLAIGALAEDAAACHFRRRACCEYPPAPCWPVVYAPCADAAPSPSGGTKATKELAKEVKDLAKKIEKPKDAVPETPSDVAKILGGK